jgi:hypothetical protein
VVQEEALNRIAGFSSDPISMEVQGRGRAAHIMFGMAIDPDLNRIDASRRLPTRAYSSPEAPVQDNEFAAVVSSGAADTAHPTKPPFHAEGTRH